MRHDDLGIIYEILNIVGVVITGRKIAGVTGLIGQDLGIVEMFKRNDGTHALGNQVIDNFGIVIEGDLIDRRSSIQTARFLTTR